MDFLRKFETSIQAIGAGALKAPQVIYVKDVNKTLFSKYGIPNGSFVAVQDIDGQLTLEPINALMFTALDGSTISLTNYGGNTPNVLYSRDGVTWTLWDYSAISIATGETLFIRGTNPLGFSSSGTVYSKFNMTGSVAVSGNIMALITGGATSSLVIPKNHCFYSLFDGCTSLVSVNKNMLPATTLKERCYGIMFKGCTSLTTAPELPATALSNFCYSGMFQNCTALTTAPELPATTLTNYCYSGMFNGCTSLTTAPELPATTLKDYCYNVMFQNCTALTTAPALHATTLASNCFNSMFKGCTSLTTAHALPATTLTQYCYKGMFSNCTSLTTAPELPATTLKDYCYNSMFYGCTSLTTAPALPATTLTKSCYGGMFSGCTKLNYIKCLATDISAANCTSNWVNGVAATGTFVKNASMTGWTTGANGIPSDWTVQNAA